MANNDNFADELFRRIANGDHDALGALYKDQRNLIYFRCYKMTKSVEASEDLLQDCFVRLWQQREKLAKANSPSAYFNTLCTNLILTYLKKMSSQEEFFERMEPLQAVSADPYNKILLEEDFERLRKGISMLTPQRRRVILLKKYKHMSNKEIAEVLGLTRETVKSHAINAMTDLRKNFGLFG